MADYQSGFGTYGAARDRKLEIVIGRDGLGAGNGYRPRPQAVVASRKGKGSSSSAPTSWGFNDPEMKRRKRVARYKVYAVEGRVKASFRKGLRWIKNKCSELVHSW